MIDPTKSPIQTTALGWGWSIRCRTENNGSWTRYALIRPNGAKCGDYGVGTMFLSRDLTEMRKLLYFVDEAPMRVVRKAMAVLGEGTK
jgi:hypothetical protein